MRLTISQRDKLDAPYSSFVRAVVEDRQPTIKLNDGAALISLSNENNDETSDNFTLQHTDDFDDLLVSFTFPDVTVDHRTFDTRAI